MKITATQANGKHYAEVRDGDRIVFRTQGYYTARMALADAQCWCAFHGEDNMNPALEAARLAGLAMAAKMEAEDTVTVSSGTHVLPWEMAFELRKPAPHPRHNYVGNGYFVAMSERQQLRMDVAALLSIPVAEVRDVIRQLKANKR